MTKEELEKEAEKHADGIYHYKINVSDYGEDGIINYRYSDIKEAYIKGAEPREKQIQIDAEQIRALQKQNGELQDELTKKADTNHQLVEQLAKVSEENAELKKSLHGIVYMATSGLHVKNQIAFDRCIAEAEKLLKEGENGNYKG